MFLIPTPILIALPFVLIGLGMAGIMSKALKGTMYDDGIRRMLFVCLPVVLLGLGLMIGIHREHFMQKYDYVQRMHVQEALEAKLEEVRNEA